MERTALLLCIPDNHAIQGDMDCPDSHKSQIVFISFLNEGENLCHETYGPIQPDPILKK
jgi:hypothetical protein